MHLNNSLRLRVLMASGFMLVLCIGLLMLSVMRSFETVQYGSIKKELAADANVLLTAARIEDGQLLMPEKMPDEKFNEVESKVLGMVFDRQGNLLWRSRSTLDEVVRYAPDFDDMEIEFERVTTGSEDYFFYDIDVNLDGVPLIFVALIPASDYNDNELSFRRSLLFWLLLTAVAMLVVLWCGMHWSLKPIKQLAENLKDIEAGKMERMEGRYPRELATLANGLNQLLLNERQQRERYRDAMADLAHSLKTPLAVLQSVQHSHYMQRSDAGLVGGELEKTVDEQVQRMNQIVSYQLQRAVTRQRGLVKNYVDVAWVAERISRTLDKVYRDKRVEFSLTVVPGCEFTGNEQDLMEVIGNLLENAYKLCLQQVRLGASITPAGELELVVEDDGRGVPESRRQSILKRGVREDSRTSGQGIGLAVTVDIVDSYDGHLEIEDSELGGALFRVIFPS